MCKPILLIIALAFITFITPLQGFAANPGCVNVSGAIAGNVIGSDPVTVLGTVTGDLQGATQAVVTKQENQSDGSIKLTLGHVFVTDSRDSIQTSDTALWIPVSGKAGVFHMSTKYTIKGGTGKFKNAEGKLENHGEADTNSGLLTLGYRGKICGVTQ